MVRRDRSKQINKLLVVYSLNASILEFVHSLASWEVVLSSLCTDAELEAA